MYYSEQWSTRSALVFIIVLLSSFILLSSLWLSTTPPAPTSKSHSTLILTPILSSSTAIPLQATLLLSPSILLQEGVGLLFVSVMAMYAFTLKLEPLAV